MLKFSSSQIQAQALYLKKFKTLGLSLFQAFSDIRLIKPCACGFFTGSQKKARKLNCEPYQIMHYFPSKNLAEVSQKSSMSPLEPTSLNWASVKLRNLLKKLSPLWSALRLVKLSKKRTSLQFRPLRALQRAYQVRAQLRTWASSPGLICPTFVSVLSFLKMYLTALFAQTKLS